MRAFKSTDLGPHPRDEASVKLELGPEISFSNHVPKVLMLPVTVNFLCELDQAVGCPNTWFNIDFKQSKGSKRGKELKQRHSNREKHWYGDRSIAYEHEFRKLRMDPFIYSEEWTKENKEEGRGRHMGKFLRMWALCKSG